MSAELKTAPQFAGECIGVSLTNRGANDSHKIVSLFIEDDGNWHPKAAFSQHWLAEAIRVLQEAQAAITGRATPAPGAPAGFKLVPIEPTPEMIAAGQDAQNRACYQKPQPVGGEWGAVYYRAMLDAAPGAPGQESVPNSTHD